MNVVLYSVNLKNNEKKSNNFRQTSDKALVESKPRLKRNANHHLVKINYKHKK